MPFCAVENGQLYYETAGDSSKPAVIFLHAGIADSRMWRGQIDAFAAHYHVVTYDWRGAGQTESASNIEFSHRDDLRALMDHLGIANAAMIGCSRGGMTAMDTALETPERIRALVMVGSAPTGLELDPPETEIQLFTELEALWTEMSDIDHVNARAVEVWLDGVRGQAGRVQGEARDLMLAMNRQHLVNYDETQRALPLTPPAAQRVSELKLPVLVVWGDLDETYTELAMRFMLDNIANARAHLIAGTAHLPNLEKPEEFNRVTLEFLASAL